MRYSREILGVTESPLVKIGTLAESMPGSIKLCYGESDMPTPEWISRAAYDAALAGHTFYTHPAGYGELRQAIADKIRAIHRVEYRPSEITVTVGATMGVFNVIRALLGEGDNAIVISPAYSLFVNAIVLSGGEPRPVALARDSTGYALDVDAIRSTIDSRTRLICVNSPSNPTGWTITADEQRALYELAVERDLAIISDEVYDRLSFGQPIARSFANVADDKDRIVVVNSFSKTYNMTGWRLGWVQASERTIKLMSSGAEFVTSSAAAMIQQAGIVALRDGEAYVQELRAYYTARRAQVMSALKEAPRLTLDEPQGAFYAFAAVDGVTDSAAFALDLLNATGVAVAPGSAFGAAGEGHVRICFAANETVLAEALGRIREYLLT
jgi:aspartate/methionine/tyrosine aminotransferase